MNEPVKLGWKEKYAAMIVLMVGLFYLFLQISNLLSSKAPKLDVTTEKLVISRAELISDLKTWFYVLLGMGGGILLLLRKKLGWIFAITLLVQLLIIFTGVIVDNAAIGLNGLLLFFLGFSAIILISALVFLLLPGALEKYRVSRKTILPTLVFLTLTVLMFFKLK